jgi:hypothetical protein
MVVSWADPVASSEEEVEWLRGSVSASRLIWVMYNPEPSNGVSVLDERRRGDVPGLGPFEIRFMSDVWTVCALLKSYVSIPTPSPETTIYYMRIILTQTTAIRSPRDDPDTPPIVVTTTFVVSEKGIKPPPRPSPNAPALWRGTAAQGLDTKGGDINGLSVSGIGRLPNDETGRPSTMDEWVNLLNVSLTPALLPPLSSPTSSSSTSSTLSGGRTSLVRL